MSSDEGASYASSGVDIDAADRAVDLMRASIGRASRPEVIGGVGGFAGLFDAGVLARFDRPLLATSTDGVGTKSVIATRMGVYDTIGRDLVGMLVDDLVVVGAEPLFVTDYIACGKLIPERVAAIVSGVAEGCRLAGAALVGGETAEHPGTMAEDSFDIAGATTGVVDADNLLGPERVRAGDVVVAMASSGLHSNGYSLVRHVFFERAGWEIDRDVAELGRTLGEELLEPTRIYAVDCLELAEQVPTHGFAHITGGGLAANLARVLPDGLGAVVNRATWSPPPVMTLLASLGRVPRDELERALNMGVGMVAVLPAPSVDDALTLLAARGVRAWVAGQVIEAEPAGQPGVSLVGDYS